MKPHQHADILRAIADGKKIQMFEKGVWYDAGLRNFASYCGRTEFRIAPETITINEVECPKPMPNDDSRPSYRVAVIVGNGCGPDSTQIYYATEADARKVYEALIKPFKE